MKLIAYERRLRIKNGGIVLCASCQLCVKRRHSESSDVRFWMETELRVHEHMP
jgi:hypothetical protein